MRGRSEGPTGWRGSPVPRSSPTRHGNDGIASQECPRVQEAFRTGARRSGEALFRATDAGGTVYAGNLAPKGQKGSKFSLFLDDGSSDAFSADVAARGAVASGLAASSVLGESSKLTLRLRGDGSIVLEIKSEVLVNGFGSVVFKARFAGAAPANPSE